MTVKQEVRSKRNNAKKLLEAEISKHNAEAFALMAARQEEITAWRLAAMSWMTDDLWRGISKKIQHKRRYYYLRTSMIEAHSEWIEAYGELAVAQANKEWAKAIYLLIEWGTRGTGFGNGILGKAPKWILM